MRLLKQVRTLLPVGLILFSFLIEGCTETVYVHKNGTYYNDYEVVTNYRIKSATKKPKIQTSKAPNWKKYRY